MNLFSESEFDELISNMYQISNQSFNFEKSINHSNKLQMNCYYIEVSFTLFQSFTTLNFRIEIDHDLSDDFVGVSWAFWDKELMEMFPEEINQIKNLIHTKLKEKDIDYNIENLPSFDLKKIFKNTI